MEETKLKERKLTKRKITMLVILGIVLLIGISYAIWQMVFVQSNPNLLSNSCFTTAFIEGEAIDLNNAFPMTSNESKTLSPFTFTIKNTCDLAAQYQINLEVLPTTPDSPLSNEYVRSSLNNSGGNILTDLSEVETTIPTATRSYMLKTGTLPSGASVTYDLRLWMDEDTPLIEGQNKVFKSKIVIITSPTVSPNILMAVSDVDCDEWGTCTGFLGGGDIDLNRDNIETITFTNTNEVPLDALYSWDVSEAQDGSVMAWYKEGSSPWLYDVWIGGKGGVSANPDSSYLFAWVASPNIDFTYFDTSSVTDMSYMFSEAYREGREVDFLDFGSWDTSNVTDMSYMFYHFSTGFSSNINLESLNSWNTSSVTNMSNMFYGVGSQALEIVIDLSDWDVSSVTDMSYMFFRVATWAHDASFTLGDLSHWDVSSVIDMSYMFSDTATYNVCGLNLNLEDWITSNVISMQGMFSKSGVNYEDFTIGNLSHWDVSNVEDMSEMFYLVTKITSLDLSNWSIGSVTNMVGMFGSTYDLEELHLDNWGLPTATKTSMFGGSNGRPFPDNLKIYVQDAAMESWLMDPSVFLPANAAVIY